MLDVMQSTAAAASSEPMRPVRVLIEGCPLWVISFAE
jgi:hypothetical protein